MKRSLLLLLAAVCLRTAWANQWVPVGGNTPDAEPPTQNSPQLSSTAPSNISAIWANEGGDKVSQDELRASHKTENLTGTIVNRSWDGSTIRLQGARNEFVSFNLVLEAANARAS